MNSLSLAMLVGDQLLDNFPPLPEFLCDLPQVSILESDTKSDNVALLDWFVEPPSLKVISAGTAVELQLDFSRGTSGYRVKPERLRSETLLKAVGWPQHKNYRVCDGTAGVGSDAQLMLAAGLDVTLVEQHPLLAGMLSRATSAPVHCACTTEWLNQSANQDQFDVVYLDPMFPARQKSALVKKQMQALQSLLGHAEQDINYRPLMDAALRNAHHRVVVKRPAQADNLAGLAPSYSYKGKAVRFDVYRTDL